MAIVTEQQIVLTLLTSICSILTLCRAASEKLCNGVGARPNPQIHVFVSLTTCRNHYSSIAVGRKSERLQVDQWLLVRT
eukprot:980820-Amphidinium_carterae.1